MLTIAILFILLIHPAPVLSLPAERFYEKEGEVYDSWFVLRTNAFKENGFFGLHDEFSIPIVYESLGNYEDVALEIGKNFMEKYPDKHYRAERIFRFVRDGVSYAHDLDVFGYKEFAQNADELIERIEKGKAYGDCEDVAILLAVLYKSAGFRSAIVVVPNHAATLVYLPEYKYANYFWEYKNESGWIWAEATGRTNRLGWTPEEFIGGDVLIKEIGMPRDIDFKKPEGLKEVEIKIRESAIHYRLLPFSSIIGLMWILSMITRLLRD